MICFFVILFISVCSPHVYSGIIQEKEELILYTDGNYILNLPEGMKSALSKFNPDFEEWKTKDYTSAVLEDVKKDGNPKRAPFAIIIDANRDDIPDIVIDGHDKNNSLLICILSDKENFEVLVIEKNAFCIPSEIESFFDGKKQTGLNYFLWPSELDGISDSSVSYIFTLGFPQQTNADAALLNDGGIIDYYFENGSFRGEPDIL
jgi:hypothetical protein